MTVATTSRTTGNASTEGILAQDISDIIFHVGEPSEAPLIALTGGKLYTTGDNKPKEVKGRIKREVSTEVDYKIVEKDPLARSLTVSSAVSDTTTTTVVTSSNSNATVGDTLYNKNTGEMLFVTAVDSGGANLTCRRNLGSTSFTIGAADTLEIIGWAGRQGGSKRSMKSQLAATRTRYCQIFKRSFGVTDTLMNVLLETKSVDAWDEEMTQSLVDHKKDIEFSFWLNAAVDSSTDASSYTAYLTRGIIAELGSTYTTDCEGNLDEDKFFGTVCEDVFEYGPRRKMAFADSKFKSRFDSWARVKQQTKAMDTDYGLSVTEIETGHGILEVSVCGVFDKFFQDADKGYMVVLDLDRVVYKYINKRDSKYEADIQTPGDDAREGQFITECGVSLRSLAHHRIVKNIG